MKDRHGEFVALGADVLAVSFSPPSFLKAYRQDNPLPFPVVSDPERLAYRGLGLDRTTWAELLRPAVLLRYLRLMARGWLPWRSRAGDDLLQLGGDFVLDRQRRLVYAFRSTEPTDRPAVDALLAAVRAVP